MKILPASLSRAQYIQKLREWLSWRVRDSMSCANTMEVSLTLIDAHSTKVVII